MSHYTTPIASKSNLRLTFDWLPISENKIIIFYHHGGEHWLVGQVIIFNGTEQPIYGKTFKIIDISSTYSNSDLYGCKACYINDNRIYFAYQTFITGSSGGGVEASSISRWSHMILEINENDEIMVRSNQVMTDVVPRHTNYCIDCVYLPDQNQIMLSYLARTDRWVNAIFNITENDLLSLDHTYDVINPHPDSFWFDNAIKIHPLPSGEFLISHKNPDNSKLALVDNEGTLLHVADLSALEHQEIGIIDSHNYIGINNGQAVHYARDQTTNDIIVSAISNVPGNEFLACDIATPDNKNFIAMGVRNDQVRNLCTDFPVWSDPDFNYSDEYLLATFSASISDGTPTVTYSSANFPVTVYTAYTVLPYTTKAIFPLNETSLAVVRYNVNGIYQEITIEIFNI